MTVPAAWALQTALYDALVGDLELQSVLGTPPRVYDSIPPDAVYPLMEIGGSRAASYAGVEGGFEHLVRISAWSRWGGRKECKLVMGAVQRVLQNAELDLEDHTLIQARIVFDDHLKYREPDIYQAVMRYRFVTIPASVGAAS